MNLDSDLLFKAEALDFLEDFAFEFVYFALLFLEFSFSSDENCNDTCSHYQNGTYNKTLKRFYSLIVIFLLVQRLGKKYEEKIIKSFYSDIPSDTGTSSCI